MLAGAAVVVLLSLATVRRGGMPAGGVLLPAARLGRPARSTLAASRDLLTLVVALEVVSLPAFALVALRRVRRPGQRGGAQAVPRLGGLHRGDAVRRSPGLRRHRPGAPRPDRHRAGRPRQPRAACSLLGVVLTLAGFGVQGRRGAVPLLGAGHLRGRAGAGRGLPLGGVQGGRLRRAGAAADPWLRAVRRRVGADARGARRGDHDRRQPGRAAAAAGRAAAGLVVGRAVRLHAGAARRRRRSADVERRRCRRPSPTSLVYARDEPRRVRRRDRWSAGTGEANLLADYRGARAHRAADRVRAGVRRWPAWPACRPGCSGCSPRSSSSGRRSTRAWAGWRS